MYKIETINVDNTSLAGFDINNSYSYEDAKRILMKIRASNGIAEMFPEEYANPKISETQAAGIASNEYNKAKMERPDNYGEFTKGVHSPIYYSFYCRDFEKEEDGMSPGILSFKIDKTSGKLLSKAELKEYRRINYSF